MQRSSVCLLESGAALATLLVRTKPRATSAKLEKKNLRVVLSAERSLTGWTLWQLSCRRVTMTLLAKVPHSRNPLPWSFGRFFVFWIFFAPTSLRLPLGRCIFCVLDWSPQCSFNLSYFWRVFLFVLFGFIFCCGRHFAFSLSQVLVMLCGLHAVISGILAGFRNMFCVSFAPTLAIFFRLFIVAFWPARSYST